MDSPSFSMKLLIAEITSSFIRRSLSSSSRRFCSRTTLLLGLRMLSSEPSSVSNCVRSVCSPDSTDTLGLRCEFFATNLLTSGWVDLGFYTSGRLMLCIVSVSSSKFSYPNSNRLLSISELMRNSCPLSLSFRSPRNFPISASLSMSYIFSRSISWWNSCLDSYSSIRKRSLYSTVFR